jgi:simple sugar transport system permease protein
VVLIGTLAAFGLPVGPSLELIGQGAFGDKFGIARSAVKATPLLLTGLGIVVAWRARMYNIGGEGQFLVGALFGAAIAKASVGSVPPALCNVAILAGSVIGGSLWAMLAGWLFVRRGVDVVISTILLNFIALEGLSWAVSGPLQERKRQLPLTEALPDSVMLQRFDRQTDLHSGVVIALLATVLVYVFLFRTKAGFRLRVVGDNDRVARVNGIDPDRVRIMAMALSGALCGLAGGVEYLGLAGQLSTKFSQNWGFLAIPVALLGALHPLALILSAGYFGALFAGSENLARFTPAGSTLVYVIQAAAVLGFVALRSWRAPKAVPAEATG